MRRRQTGQSAMSLHLLANQLFDRVSNIFFFTHNTSRNDWKNLKNSVEKLDTQEEMQTRRKLGSSMLYRLPYTLKVVVVVVVVRLVPIVVTPITVTAAINTDDAPRIGLPAHG